MKLNNLIIVAIALLLNSCDKSILDEPCPQYLPPIPTTPAFVLIDKATGQDIFGKKVKLEDIISASQPCNSIKLGVMQLDYPHLDTIAHNFFMLQHQRFNVGYDKDACHTIYITLNGNDIDTLEFSGVVNVYEDRCGTTYNFEIRKINYNGREAPLKSSGPNAGQGVKYYRLEK